MKKKHKRFIAGAVCPRCGKLDKLLIYQLAARSFRECVDCDFREEQQFTPIARELGTRVSGDAAALEQVVRFIEPK